MKELTEVFLWAAEEGFSHWAYLDCGGIELKEEVRRMCAAGVCGQYGRNWSCPPFCGGLDVCRERVSRYSRGILVQTVGDLEDNLDYEGMKAAENRHKRAFRRLAERLRLCWPELLALGAGCCTVCRKCSCPDEDCRFPEKRLSSMEAYGIVVSELCRKNHMDYYYGPDKVSYTSCYLLD